MFVMVMRGWRGEETRCDGGGSRECFGDDIDTVMTSRDASASCDGRGECFSK